MRSEAVKHRLDRVFCPETVRELYENPAAVRARAVQDVQRLNRELPPNELIDTLVIGADHPLILQTREDWEREHARQS